MRGDNLQEILYLVEEIIKPFEEKGMNDLRKRLVPYVFIDGESVVMSDISHPEKSIIIAKITP